MMVYDSEGASGQRSLVDLARRTKARVDYETTLAIRPRRLSSWSTEPSARAEAQGARARSRHRSSDLWWECPQGTTRASWKWSLMGNRHS